MKRDLWNKCDSCGKIIPYADLESGAAIHVMVEPSSDLSEETYETLCSKHNQNRAGYGSEASLNTDNNHQRS